jgi:ATP-dependent HslUV protease subunit HslV
MWWIPSRDAIGIAAGATMHSVQPLRTWRPADDERGADCRKSVEIAAKLCIYTDDCIHVEVL